MSGSAAPKSRYTEADDPKRLVALDRQISDQIDRYQRGDIRGAIAIAEEIVKKRPDMALTLTHLAFLYNEVGDRARAVGAIRRALEVNPAAPEIAALYGAYLTEAGLPKEAVTRLAPYMQATQPDTDVAIAYGAALGSSGRPDDALSVFEKARALDPTNGLPLTNIGMLRLMKGDAAGAQAAFVESLQIDPGLARAHNGLGVVAAEHGAFDQAIAEWKQAVALDPHDHQALYNLGDVLIRLRKPDEARGYWERFLREAPADSADRSRVRTWLAAGRRASSQH
jgi:Tfp pilus assembly protein PilF